jgi:IMP dehydrogenase
MASSFLENKFVPEGLTYDDVLLVPAYSEVLPREVNIASSFTKPWLKKVV